jgi:hypothetical protein
MPPAAVGGGTRNECVCVPYGAIGVFGSQLETAKQQAAADPSPA